MSCGRRSKARVAGGGIASLAAFAAVVAASAQAKAAPPRAGDTGGKFQKRQSAQSTGPAEAARARVREGDCKGALPLFDDALRTSVDPTLFRDRGLCHDKLGNVYPAIDDYRAYVFAAPDEPDVDTIRQRISELQGNAPPAEGDEQSTNANQGSLEVQSNAQVIARPTTAKKATLKGGSGVGLGAYFGAGALFFNDPNNTASTYEKIGLQLRADFAPVHALVLEGGYFHMDDKTYTTSAVSPAGGTTSTTGTFPGGSGFNFLLEYELRLRLDRSFSNQLTFAIGGTIAHFSETQTAGGISGNAAQTLYGPSARVSYRHVFSNTLALDLAIEPAYLWDHPTETLTVSGTTTSSSSGSSTNLNAVQVGGFVALIFGP
jgi:hypothetical protein